MMLKSLPKDLDELRKTIISSNLTTCYLILNELAGDKPVRYQKFKDEWIHLYDDTYKLVSKMKPRVPKRQEE